MSISPQKINALDKTISCLENMISACKDLQSGVSEHVVCQKYNLDTEMFATLIRKEWKYDNNIFAKTKCSRGYYVNWRDFFCFILYGDSVRPLDDFDESFNLALSILTDSEKEIITKYFKDGLQLVDIAKERGITQQGLRVSYNSACRKLRDDRIRDYFRLGIEVIKKQDENIFLRRQRDEINTLLQELEKRNSSLKDDISQLKSRVDSYGVLNIRKYPLESVPNMSHRLYNSLKRNNILYLDEVLFHNKDWFLGLKNFGKQSLNELVELSQSLGLHFKE